MRRSNQYYNENDIKPNQNRNIYIKRAVAFDWKDNYKCKFCDDNVDEKETNLANTKHISTQFYCSTFDDTMYVVVNDTTKMEMGDVWRRWWAVHTKSKWFHKSIFGMKAVLCAMQLVDEHTKSNKICIFYRSLSHIRRWTFGFVAVKQIPARKSIEINKDKHLFVSLILKYVIIMKTKQDATTSNWR